MQARKLKLYKIGDLAKLVGKTPRALRLYEQQGLLEPRQRSSGGFRLYGSEAVTRIRTVDQLQTLGMSLSAISALLSGRYCESGSRIDDINDIFKKSIQKVEEQLVRLAKLKDELKASHEFFRACTDCKEPELFEACRDCDRSNCSNIPELVRGLIGMPDTSAN